MAIKTINGILKADSTKTSEEFNNQIKSACDNAENTDTTNNYVGLVFNLKDKRIDFVPSSSVGTDFNVNTTTIVDGSGAGVSTDDAYVRPTAVPTTIGGATVGTTFSGTVADALDKILYPFIKPTFLTFYPSGQNATLEVGDKISGGLKTFIWTTSTSANININTIKITSNTTTLVDLSANDGTETIDIGADIIKTTATSHNFNIYGVDKENNSFSKLYTVSWRWKIYYGSSSLTVLNGLQVASLQGNVLGTSRASTYSTTANDYKWICYPSSFGLATKFEDTATGFGVAMEAPLTISVTNAFGVATDYFCYRTTNSMASALNIKVS